MAAPEWIERWTFEVARVATLPRPDDLESPPCMVGFARVLRRRIGRTPRECCWYHQVDWKQANRTAITLLRFGQEAGAEGTAFDDFVMEAIEGEPIGEKEKEAALSLLTPFEAIQIIEPDDWGGDVPMFQDGRHRITAMRDARVRSTVIARLDLLDPATGGPLTPPWE